ncbi:MAG: hypothetical protein V3T01_09030 [Myxococcota bacterium]
MARSKIPKPLERRLLIERKLGETQALQIAEAYLAEGRAIEAVDFLRLGHATDRLRELRRQAVESGDAFLFRAAVAATGEEPEASEWKNLADAADAAGKEGYAAEARRQAGRGED